MGQISRKLAKRFDADRRGLRLLREELRKVLNRDERVPDPVHRAYVRIQNLASAFAENVSRLPEFKPYYDLVCQAEDEYMPAQPPISPLTGSYFTMWAFFDLRFGRNSETIGTILLDVSEQIGLSPEDFTAARHLQQSRMGIYEVSGVDGSHHCLRELMTDDEVPCLVTSGYTGQAGQLWYVRLGAPTAGHDYHVTLTTPYILHQVSKEEWTAYLERAMSRLTGDNIRSRLQHLLKYGSNVNGWNEFVFQGYCGYQSDAIFLTGVPDQPETLPHADATGRRRCG